MHKNKHNWDKNFDELKKFVEKNGVFPTKKQSVQLYTWCAIQRLRYKDNTILPENIIKLNSINFTWNLQETIWKNNFSLLLNYRKKYPERWPSQRSKEPTEHKLAVWFLGIRKDFKSGKLTKNRIDDLKSIDFPFNPREYRWLENFNKLKTWMDANKRFPKRGSKEKAEDKLFNWLRYQAIKMQNHVLEDYQSNKLHNLGITDFINNLKDFEVM